MESSNTLLLLATLSVACTNDSQLGRIDRDEDITEDTTVPAALPDPDYTFREVLDACTENFGTGDCPVNSSLESDPTCVKAVTNFYNETTKHIVELAETQTGADDLTFEEIREGAVPAWAHFGRRFSHVDVWNSDLDAEVNYVQDEGKIFIGFTPELDTNEGIMCTFPRLEVDEGQTGYDETMESISFETEAGFALGEAGNMENKLGVGDWSIFGASRTGDIWMEYLDGVGTFDAELFNNQAMLGALDDAVVNGTEIIAGFIPQAPTGGFGEERTVEF